MTREVQEERFFKTDVALERFQQYHSYSYREIDHSTMDIAHFAAISHWGQITDDLTDLWVNSE